MSELRPLGTSATIRLVAGREIRTRILSKAFLLLTGVFVVAVVLGGLVFKLVGSDADPVAIGVLPDASGISQQISDTGKAVGVDVKVTDVPDAATARSQLRDGTLDAVVVSTTPTFAVEVHEEVDDKGKALLGSLAQQLALAGAVTDLGGDPATVAQTVATAAPDVTVLDPKEPRDGGQIAAGYIAGILLFITLMNAGQLVAQGVVEEKSSRVVELLLATVRPWQLMAGKVLGIGAVGLLQLVAIVGAGAASVVGFGLLDSTSLDIGTAALWALVWFVIGFTSYALALAALASLVSRQEDIGSVTGPVIAFMVVPYVIAVSVAPWDPDNPLVKVLSFVPFASPLVMPVRIALGTAAAWENLVAIALSIALLPVLVWFAGRVYSGAVLHAGGRLSIKQALRGQ